MFLIIGTPSLCVMAELDQGHHNRKSMEEEITCMGTIVIAYGAEQSLMMKQQHSIFMNFVSGAKAALDTNMLGKICTCLEIHFSNQHNFIPSQVTLIQLLVFVYTIAAFEFLM